MANNTGDRNLTSKLSRSESPSGILEFLSALNIFLSIAASLGNALILIALHKVSSIHPPTKLFFRCLAVTDLCIGLIVEPMYAAHIISTITDMEAKVVANVCGVLSLILCGISVLMSTAISVDRLLALLLGLRYRHVVTLKRVRVVIICSWLIGVSPAWIWLWREDVAKQETVAVIILSLVTSIFCYTRIHLKLRHHQVQVQNNFPQGQPNGEGIPLNIERYKKIVSGILWVQLALAACFVQIGVMALLYANGIENDTSRTVAISLIYLNSSLNPFLYCWKIKDVRQAVKDTIRQLCWF